MDVQKLSKIETLTLIRNGTQQEQCVAEINLEAVTRQQRQTLMVGANPQMSQAITEWENRVKNTMMTIQIIDNMMIDELRNEKKREEKFN